VRSPAHSLGREDATDGKTGRPTLAAIANCAATFSAELAADAPNGVPYAETLTIGLALHLFANHSLTKDQPHLTRAFHRVFCMTPAMYQRTR
jgi:hypothetical protein